MDLNRPSLNGQGRASVFCCRKRRRLRYHFASSPDPRRDIFQKAKMKSLRISVIIVLAFIICWTPYYFMMITFIFLKPDEQLGENMQSAIFFFGMSNSLVNKISRKWSFEFCDNYFYFSKVFWPVLNLRGNTWYKLNAFYKRFKWIAHCNCRYFRKFWKNVKVQMVGL